MMSPTKTTFLTLVMLRGMIATVRASVSWDASSKTMVVGLKYLNKSGCC